MMDRCWVADTSVYTHLARADLLTILPRLAPGGLLLIPDEVNAEIKRGREAYGVPSIKDFDWITPAVLTPEEEFTFLAAKARLGGAEGQHRGESAVISVAKHRDGVALLDDKAARIVAGRPEFRVEAVDHASGCRSVQNARRVRPGLAGEGL